MTDDSDLKYGTTADLAYALGSYLSVPDWDVGNSPSNENVGIGDGSTSVFYLDQKNIVYGSYTLYYGSDSSTTDTLTETTHYSLDLDDGKITLTAAGITLLSTNTIFAKYDYINIGMKISYLADVMLRSEKELDNMVNSTFTDGTSTNPSYPFVDEIHASNGFHEDRFIVRKKPLIDVSSTLSGDITAVATSIALSSGDGAKLPTSGYIVIGSEVIAYTGISTDTLNGCTRGSLGTTAATHSSGDEIHTTIFFRSDTSEGTAVSWTIQPWNTSMYADSNGLVYKFKDSDPDGLYRLGVASRVRIIYYYGHDTIPQDIKRLNIILSKRMLIRDNVGKSMIQGRDEFRPEMYNIDQDEINSIVGSYVIYPMGNT